MEKELIKEIPCLPLDKLMSIFKPDKDDVYRHGLLSVGARLSAANMPTSLSCIRSA